MLRHDTRNQAQIIQSETEKLLNDQQEPKATAEQIQHANQRLTDLAEQARKLQAMLSGTDSNREFLDLVTLIEGASDAAQERHPDLTLEYDLPEQQLVFVPPLFEDAIEHLLCNAAQHTDSETPCAEVRLRVDESSQRPIALEVADTGPGIPESEPILSDNPDESQLHHSNGFGLWFVKWVIDDSGGVLSFETPAEGEVGTVVTIRLPEPPDKISSDRLPLLPETSL